MQMRLMALLAVCSSKEGQEVKFSAVEEALALDPGTAEGWLVQAFGKQLLDGRINQVLACTDCVIYCINPCMLLACALPCVTMHETKVMSRLRNASACDGASAGYSSRRTGKSC